MKAKRFNLATILCALFSAAFLSVGIVFTVPAKASDVTGEQAQSIFVMDEGASVRIGEEGTADVNGLKFTASMTDANYQGLFGENGSVGEGKTYSKATFGMLIAPASYEGLNYANVFGQEAIYGWSLFDEETGEWLPYEGEKTEIINIYNQKLYQVVDAETLETSWEFRGGSITNLVGEWIATDFQGLAYVELTRNDGTGCDYIMANAGQIANMYEVAVKSYYDENSELTADDKAWIKANYIEAASEAVAVNVGLVPAGSVDLAEYGLPAGEYDFYIQQYIEKTTSESNAHPFIAYKDYIGEKAAPVMDGTVVDTSSLEGTYQITAAFSGTEYGYTFYIDSYTPGIFVWDNLYSVEENVRISDTWGSSRGTILDGLNITKVDKANDPIVADKDGEYYRLDTTFSTLRYAVAGSPLGLNVFPVHSKAYYSTLFSGKDIKMDYYYSKIAEDGSIVDNGIQWQFNVPLGKDYVVDYAMPYDSWTGRENSGWLARNVISIDKIVNAWDRFIASDSGDYAEILIGYQKAIDSLNGDTYGEVAETHTGDIVWYFGNIHLSSDAMSYKEVAYDLEGNEIATTTKSASLGSTVTYTPGEVAGYVFVPANEDNVLTGTVLGNNTLTLKAYYAPATEETISGITYQQSYDFGTYLSDIVSYKVTQYIVRGDGNKGVDVTSAYADKVTGTVLDLTSFDGIYTVTAMASDGSAHKVTFERAIEGTFTWNNINEFATGTQYGIGRAGIWADKASSYPSGNTLVTSAVDPTDSVVAGREGYYYKVSGTSVTEFRNTHGFKIYPVHSKAYYEGLLVDGEVWYVIDTYIQKSTADNWNGLVSYGLGYSSSQNDNVYGSGGLRFEYQENTWGDGKLNSYGYKTNRKLSGIVNNWDSLLKIDNGGYFWGGRNLPADTATEINLYLGNIHLVNAYQTEYYTYNAETATYDLATTVRGTHVENKTGTAISADTSYAIDGYAYVQNENEVITGTYGVATTTFKVYYNPTGVEYDVEIYKYDGSAYVKDETLSYTATGTMGATAYIDEDLVVEGYLIDLENANTVASGTIDATNKLVLKAYYVPAITETIEGLRSEATLDLGIGEVTSYTLTQYVVNTTNGTTNLNSAATLSAESYTGVDVKAAYPELIANGVANTSMLDGIFKLTAKGPNGIAEYKFEQYKEGVFTWNNIAEEGTGIASVGMNSRYMWDGAGKYTGTATTSYVTAEDEKFAPIHAGEVASGTIGTGDDRWWRATADKPTSNTTSMGVRVFPSHTWNYYNTLYNGKVMTFDYFVADEAKSAKTSFECWVAPLTYVELNGSAHTWGYGHIWMHDSFKLTENAFVALTCTNQTSKIRGGSFLTLTNHQNGNFTGPMSIYVGNFGVADGYNVEYYLEQTQEVEGVKTGLGTYSTIPNRIETFTVAVGTEVTANTALSVSTGYAYAANENEILTGTVSADGCITLKVYYKYGA